jgi:septum formation protein
MTPKKITLASQSPRRKELLAYIYPDFQVKTADIDEAPLTYENSDDYVLRMARTKNEALLAQEDELILSADTIVVYEGEILQKPRSEAEAFAMLSALSGDKHDVVTAVTMRYNDRMKTFISKAEVHFYEMTDSEIKAYIATGDPMDKAGAYGIQNGARAFVKAIKGDYDAIVGLPVGKLNHELKGFLA